MSKCDNISVKVHPELGKDSLILSLASDFKKYKSSGDLFNTFGRDVPFTDEPALRGSNVYKVHILEVDEFDCRKSQYDNTSNFFHLVYCVHPDNPNAYCIIHFLSPNAHQEARKREFVSVAERRAEQFIATKVSLPEKLRA